MREIKEMDGTYGETKLKVILINSRFDDEFERKILNAIWYKVRRNTHLFVPEISKLPLEHYYNFSGKIVNVKNKYLWMIDGIDKMRNYIIEKQKNGN